MNKKILISTITLFLGTAESTQPHSNYHMESLAIPRHSTQVSIKQNIQKLPNAISSDKKSSIVTVLKEHPYKTAAGLLGGTLGLAGAAYLAYNKYQEKQLRDRLELTMQTIQKQLETYLNQNAQGKDLNTETQEDSTISAYLQKENMRLLKALQPYSTKIIYRVLSAQDDNGNTMLHNYLKKFKEKIQEKVCEYCKKSDAYQRYYFEFIIVPLINALENKDMIGTLLLIKNNENTRLLEIIHLSTWIRSRLTQQTLSAFNIDRQGKYWKLLTKAIE